MALQPSKGYLDTAIKGSSPTRLPLANLVYIDYSFKQAIFTGQFMDWLLQGEFLDIKRPAPSALQPPSFDTASLSQKMAYIWVTDYSLNTLGEVFHKGGLLQRVIPSSEILPPFLKQFLNTKTLKDVIPLLYKQYPDRPMEIGVETLKEPVFKLDSGSGAVQVQVRAYMKVIKKDNTKFSAFYLDIACNTNGEASLKTVEGQLRICGKINSKKCTLEVGGSHIGDFKLPLDQEHLDQMIDGLVLNQMNPVLANGIPLPQSPQLVLKNPSLTLVKNAVRVGTDFELRI